MKKVQNDPRALGDKRLPMESNRHLTGSLQMRTHGVANPPRLCERALFSLYVLYSQKGVERKSTATNTTQSTNRQMPSTCAISHYIRTYTYC